MASKLDKLKKPASKKFDFMGLEDSESSESSESPMESDMEALNPDMENEQAGESVGEHGDAPNVSSPSPELEQASDEDLMAELKRRGLSADMSAPSDESSSEDDEYFK